MDKAQSKDPGEETPRVNAQDYFKLLGKVSDLEKNTISTQKYINKLEKENKIYLGQWLQVSSQLEHMRKVSKKGRPLSISEEETGKLPEIIPLIDPALTLKEEIKRAEVQAEKKSEGEKPLLSLDSFKGMLDAGESAALVATLIQDLTQKDQIINQLRQELDHYKQQLPVPTKPLSQPLIMETGGSVEFLSGKNAQNVVDHVLELAFPAASPAKLFAINNENQISFPAQERRPFLSKKDVLDSNLTDDFSFIASLGIHQRNIETYSEREIQKENLPISPTISSPEIALSIFSHSISNQSSQEPLEEELKRLTEENKELHQYKEERENLDKKNETLQKENDYLQQYEEELNEQLKGQILSYKILEENNKDLSTRLAGKDEELRDKKILINQFSVRDTGMKKELKTKDGSLEKLSETNKKNEKKITNLEEQIASFATLRKRHVEKWLGLDQKISDLTDSLSRTQKDLQKKEDQIESLHNKLEQQKSESERSIHWREQHLAVRDNYITTLKEMNRTLEQDIFTFLKTQSSMPTKHLAQPLVIETGASLEFLSGKTAQNVVVNVLKLAFPAASPAKQFITDGQQVLVPQMISSPKIKLTSDLDSNINHRYLVNLEKELKRLKEEKENLRQYKEKQEQENNAREFNAWYGEALKNPILLKINSKEQELDLQRTAYNEQQLNADKEIKNLNQRLLHIQRCLQEKKDQIKILHDTLKQQKSESEKSIQHLKIEQEKNDKLVYANGTLRVQNRKIDEDYREALDTLVQQDNNIKQLVRYIVKLRRKEEIRGQGNQSKQKEIETATKSFLCINKKTQYIKQLSDYYDMLLDDLYFEQKKEYIKEYVDEDLKIILHQTSNINQRSNESQFDLPSFGGIRRLKIQCTSQGCVAKFGSIS